MDSINGQRWIRKTPTTSGGDDSSSEWTQEDCFDLVLLSFNTAKEDVTVDENGELLNDNSGQFLITDEETGVYGFCGGTEVATPGGKQFSTIVLNSRRGTGSTSNGPLIDASTGNVLVLPTVATAIHEFLHAIEFANGIVSNQVNRFFSEGIAVAVEFLCFEPVLLQMANPRSGIESLDSAEQFVSRFVQGEPGSSWSDFGSSGRAVQILWNADLATVLDQDPTQAEGPSAPLDNPYEYFLLFLLLSALVTKDDSGDAAAEAGAEGTDNRELVFFLRLFAKVSRNLASDPTPTTAVTDALLELTYGEEGGNEPLWFSTGGVQNTIPVWQDVHPSEGTTTTDASGSETTPQPGWDRAKKLKYLQHCAKCYLTELCFNTGSILSESNGRHVTNILHKLLSESPALDSIKLQLYNELLVAHDQTTFTPPAGTFTFETSEPVDVDTAPGQMYYVQTVFDEAAASASTDKK